MDLVATPPSGDMAATSLVELAAKANLLNAQCEFAVRSSIVLAVQCGVVLAEIKSQLKHGEWYPWLAENCSGIKPSKAQNYMKLAKAYPELADPNPHARGDLPPSINSALALLSAPEETKEEIEAEIEAGAKFTEKELLERIKAAKEEAAKQAEAEKNDLLTRADEWREQANANLKKLREKEGLLEAARVEAGRLRKAIADEAKNLAEAETAAMRAELERARIEKKEIEKKLKAERKKQSEAVQRGVANELRESQKEIDRMEAQKQTLEKVISQYQATLKPLEKQAADLAHHNKKIAEFNHVINQAALILTDAFDPDFAETIPDVCVEQWRRCAAKMRQGAEQLEGHVNSATNISITEKTL